MPTKHDRILGCIIGGAIGDYLGCPYEGVRGPIAPTIPKASSITDDTQLTLATCQGITRAGAVEPESIANSFVEWFSQGRVHGIGSSTLKALRDLSFGAHWALAGATGEMSAGSGAAMRIAPLSFCVNPMSCEGRQKIKEVAHLTHRNNEAFAGALAICVAIATTDFDFIGKCIEELPDSNTRDRLELLATEATPSVLDVGLHYGASGYVADSVPLALVAASKAHDISFRDAVLGVIACGGDTDTTGSMVGQIVGSKIGLSRIPQELIELAFGPEPVRNIAEEFSLWVCGSPPN